MYHVSAQGIDERMINVHYYYYLLYKKMLSYGFMSPIRYYNNQHVSIMCYMSVQNLAQT